MKLNNVLKIVEDITPMKCELNMGVFRKKQMQKKYIYIIFVLVTFTESLFAISFPIIAIY